MTSTAYDCLSRRPWLAIGVCIALVVVLARPSMSMGTEEKGNRPLNEPNYAEWKGIMPIINDKARVFNVWVNGNEWCYFEGSTKQANQALANFAKIEVKNHVVVLRPGPVKQLSFDKSFSVPYNWEIHVLGGLARSRATDDINDIEWQKDPVLTIYIGGDIELDKLEIPKGVILRAAEGKNEKAKQDESTLERITEFVNQHTKKQLTKD